MEIDTTPKTYDAILLLSYGGPEGMDEVIPFLENVLRGRNIPRARLETVAEHYRLFNGVSPINAQNRVLIAALQTELAAHDIDLPIYFGNRNWHPLLADTMRQMIADGVKKALLILTSAYSSYSSCRQYLEDIARTRAEIGPAAPQFDKIRAFYNHPGFIEANADHVKDALNRIAPERRAQTRIAFTAHSVPLSMAENSDYVAQLLDTASLIAEKVNQPKSARQLVYQSRSGLPHQPWLEPDIGDHLKALKEDGVQDVVIAPIGFISDHMEVIFDLDTEAAEISREIGLNMVRAKSAGTHPAFITGLRQLIEERLTESPIRLALGTRGPNHDVCPTNCCLGQSTVSGRPKAES